MSFEAWLLALAFGADLILGDPRRLPHPVRGFGWLVARLERVWRKAGPAVGLRVAGLLFAFSAVGGAMLVVWLSLWFADRWAWLVPVIIVYWAYTLLAVRSLDQEAGAVISEIEQHDLAAARGKLATIVGRDTENLDEPEVLRAVVETVAESLNDAIVAPLFYFGLAGPVGMAAYKAVNTLDSMVGYKNERYRRFGWASARLDDALNYVPARISALLVAFAAVLLKLSPSRAVATVMRDASRQPSPNAGYPEAAVAGAVGVRLGGLNFYGGVANRKPWLGESLVPLSLESLRQVRRILYATAALSLLLAMGMVSWRN